MEKVFSAGIFKAVAVYSRRIGRHHIFDWMEIGYCIGYLSNFNMLVKCEGGAA